MSTKVQELRQAESRVNQIRREIAEDIIGKVAMVSGVSVDAIKNGPKIARITRARYIAAKRLRSAGFSHREAGEYINTAFSNIVHQETKYGLHYAGDDEFRQMADDVRKLTDGITVQV